MDSGSSIVCAGDRRACHHAVHRTILELVEDVLTGAEVGVDLPGWALIFQLDDVG